MIKIAIIGGSATGKSSAARRLAQQHDFPVRHCGDKVKRLASARGVPFAALGDDDHRAVDLETKAFVKQARSLVVEGRYLHYVLATFAAEEELRVVELTAGIETRRRRLENRSGSTTDTLAISQSDQGDAYFVSRLYPTEVPLTAVCVDTTALDEQQVVDAILRAVSQ